MKNTVVLVNTDLVPLVHLYPLRTLEKIAPQLPIGLGYIAACLEAVDVPVKIIDNYADGMSDATLTEAILAHDPGLVGFSTTTQNIPQAFAVAEALKAEDASIKVVFGGVHATVLPRDVLGHGSIDFVIVGEGEHAMVELSRALGADGSALEGIEGLFRFDDAGEIVFNGPRPAIQELDALPFPARNLLNMTDYRLDAAVFGVERMMAVSSSRGCPFRCSFCTSSNYWQRKYRSRSPANVLDEIEFLMREYGCDGINFREDNFTVNKDRVMRMCTEFDARGLDLPWQCESRVDTVDRETLETMKAAGCGAIWFGIESGNQKTLDFLQKGITVEQIERVFGWCHELEIATGATFMIGIPGETREETKQTYAFAERIDPDWASFQAYLGLPVSKLYNHVVDHGLFAERIGDVYIIETEEMSVKEISQLENTFNEAYPKFKVMRQSENGFLRFLVRWMPLKLFKHVRRMYYRLPFSIRSRLKGSSMLEPPPLNEEYCVD